MACQRAAADGAVAGINNPARIDGGLRCIGWTEMVAGRVFIQQVERVARLPDRKARSISGPISAYLSYGSFPPSLDQVASAPAAGAAIKAVWP